MWRKGVRCQRAELAFRPISSVLSFDPQVKLPIMGVKMKSLSSAGEQYSVKQILSLCLATKAGKQT